MRALIQAAHDGRLRADIRVVISNVRDAAGLDFARKAGIETLVLPHGDYARREAFDQSLVEALRSRGVEFVCLAGFMRLLGPAFCEAFPNGVVNIHPSLLPAFPGVDAQRQALEHGVKVSGATVHFVTPALDAGPILFQRAVPVMDEDTADTLAERILAVEHEIYAAAVDRILAGHWRIEGRRVFYSDGGANSVDTTKPRR